MIIIEGYVGKLVYSNSDFKIYNFYPDEESRHLVKVHEKYRNISISGTLPTLVDDIKYKIGIEPSLDVKYKNSYTFKQLFMEDNLNDDYKAKFLKALVTEKQYETIMKNCPDIIDKVIKDEPIDTSKLQGIGEKIMAKIKEKIIDNFALAGLVAEFGDFGMTFEMLRKLFERYKSVELIREKMEKDPYECLCSINRVGFKKADMFILRKYPHFIDSEKRGKSCIEFILHQNESNGNTWISFDNLYRQIKELASQTSHHAVKLLNEDEDFYYHQLSKRVSLYATYMCEREVCNKLLEYNSKQTILSIDWSRYMEVDGFPLSEEQRQILKNVCMNNLNLLVGFGGTGKSFSTKALVDMLEDNFITYALMSPTGKASKVLKESTGRNATTIHRGLKYQPGKGFFYNMDNKLPQDVIIIDEYSMIDIFLLRDLLRAVREDAKIIFIGDPEQIPSVGAGNIAYDMLESKVIETSRLTQVFRYGEGGLSYVVTEIRLGNTYFETTQKIQTFGEKKDYTFVNASKEETLPVMKTLYQKILNQGVPLDDIMVLSAQNVGELGTANINNVIQSMVNPPSKDKPEIKVKRDNVEVTFRLGDKVMQVKNDYKVETLDGRPNPIMNGDIGVIKEINGDEITIEFDGMLCAYTKSGLQKMLLAYSISIHKSQGSQAKYVILVTPDAHTFQLNRNLLYVGSGRTKITLYHIGTFNLMKICLKKSENRSRDTWLLEMLKGEI